MLFFFFFADLILVQVYQNPNAVGDYKYRPASDLVPIIDSQNITEWEFPDSGYIQSFRLYFGNA